MPKLTGKIYSSSEMSEKGQKAAEFDLLHRPTPPFLFSGRPGTKARQRQGALLLRFGPDRFRKNVFEMKQ